MSICFLSNILHIITNNLSGLCVLAVPGNEGPDRRLCIIMIMKDYPTCGNIAIYIFHNNYVGIIFDNSTSHRIMI